MEVRLSTKCRALRWQRLLVEKARFFTSQNVVLRQDGRPILGVSRPSAFVARWVRGLL